VTVKPDLPDRLTIESIECLQLRDGGTAVRVSGDGAVGLSPGGNRLEDVLSLLSRRVAPVFLGRDARQIESLLDEVYTWQSNYKYAGMPFWYAVAVVEMATLDLLARLSGCRVCDLLGTVRRTRVRHYLSRFSRDTSAEDELAHVRHDAEVGGFAAVKLKVGGRMSDSPRQRTRDLRLIELARERLAPGTAVYLDGNGSFDAESAIRIGEVMQATGAAMFEEPCPWEDYEATRQVADALNLPVGGGEQDSSAARWKWMIENRGVDVIQPDVYYNGGLLRTARLAEAAARQGLNLMPHNPRLGFDALPALHLLAVAEKVGEFHETRQGGPAESCLGDRPGWGVEVDHTGAEVLWKSQR
jgi:L-alanine-DL-glutamate epimerase-like enolase superfamily enzyme